MRTHPEPGNVVQYSYTFTFGEHDVAALFKTWQGFVFDKTLDRRLGTMFVIVDEAAIIEAIFYGSEAEYKASGIHDRLPTPSHMGIVLNSWLGHLAHVGEGAALHASNIEIPFYNKSLGFREQDRISDELVDETFHYLSTAPRGGPDTTLIIFTVQGGATNDVAPDATSYGHRDKVMFYEDYFLRVSQVNEQNRGFFRGLQSLMKRALGAPELVATTYAGYVDLELGTGEESGPAYWGDNYPALRALKAKWDPGDVFHNPQSVVPAEANKADAVDGQKGFKGGEA